MNNVWFLQKRAFTSLSHEDQMKIKALGRPTPDLNIEITSSSRNRSYKRVFTNSVYSRAKWICGCDVKNTLFCFPCLLFGGDRPWTKFGISDLGHLTQNINRHEVSKRHLSNEVNLALLGKTDLKSEPDSAYWDHNEQVTKNRYVLSRAIDCIKFCGTSEWALHGHVETEKSDHPDMLSELVNFSADLDDILKERLDTTAIFKEISTRDVQDNLLQCMLEVCRNTIAAEISESNYVAVMADETTHISSNCQMVIILRYVHKGYPVERFWGFVNPDKHDPASPVHCILSVLDPLLKENYSKLVAQSYNGNVIMNAAAHTNIQAKYPLAHFVHCYAHQLKLVVSQAVSQNTHVRVFFSNLDDILNFFSNSQVMDVLTEVVARIPDSPQINWNFESRAIDIIYEHRTVLIECMRQIQEQFSNPKTVNQASAIERLLCDEAFLFWLDIFHNIMPHVDVLNDHLLMEKSDPEVIQCAIDNFDECISKVRAEIEFVIKREEELSEHETEPAAKRMRFSEEHLRASALEACDVIRETVKARFKFTDYLLASSLLDSDQFDSYDKTFPEDAFKTTIGTYPVFDFERLQTELSIIYTRPDFRNNDGAVALLNAIKTNNLDETFQETVKLLEILITVPMPTAEEGRCFATLERVKNFLRNSASDDRLLALSMLSMSMESGLIKSDVNFNDKVIEMFTNVTQNCDLVFQN